MIYVLKYLTTNYLQPIIKRTSCSFYAQFISRWPADSSQYMKSRSTFPDSYRGSLHVAQIDPLCQKTLIDTRPHRLARIYVIHTPQRSEDFNTLVQRHHGIK